MKFDKISDERNIYVLKFKLKHVIHILSFRVVNLLCCGGHLSYFSNTTFIDAKTKCRSLGRFLALIVEPYKDVLRMSVEDVFGALLKDVLGTSVGHVPWSYILDHIKTSSGRLQGTSSKRRQGTSLGVPYWTIWRRQQDVIFQRPEDII